VSIGRCFLVQFSRNRMDAAKLDRATSIQVSVFYFVHVGRTNPGCRADFALRQWPVPQSQRWPFGPFGLHKARVSAMQLMRAERPFSPRDCFYGSSNCQLLNRRLQSPRSVPVRPSFLPRHGSPNFSPPGSHEELCLWPAVVGGGTVQ
jgi:hypothetical protein